jgi:hypothetical protein
LRAAFSPWGEGGWRGEWRGEQVDGERESEWVEEVVVTGEWRMDGWVRGGWEVKERVRERERERERGRERGRESEIAAYRHIHLALRVLPRLLPSLLVRVFVQLLRELPSLLEGWRLDNVLQAGYKGKGVRARQGHWAWWRSERLEYKARMQGQDTSRTEGARLRGQATKLGTRAGQVLGRSWVPQMPHA